jgi:ABC-type nitrate/sulfonate/bicarbonate transport system substrate-binding protein
MKSCHGRFGVLALALVCVAAIGACGDDDSTGQATAQSAATVSTTGADATADPLAPQPLDSPQRVNVVMSTKIEPFAPVLLAEQLGEFEKENLDVTFQFLPSPDGLALLTAGRADVQVTGMSAGFVNAVAAGQPVRWVANVYSGDPSKQGFWARTEMLNSDGSLDSAKLAGAKVAVLGGVGNPSILPLYKVLQENGLSLDDIELVNLTSAADVLIALEQGSIDIGYLLSPFWTEAEEKGVAKLVFGQGFQASVYAVNSDWEADSAGAPAFFRAVARTIRDNLTGDYKATEAQRAALATAIEVEPDTLDATPLKFDDQLPLDTSTIDGLTAMWIDVGGMLDQEKPVPVEQLVDRTVIERAVGGA